METLQERHGIVAACDVKRILNTTDTAEIKDLCKQLKVYPKRDRRTGKAFFMKEDIDFLKRMKDLHEKSSQCAEFAVVADNLPVKPQAPMQDNTTMLVVNEFKGLVEKVMANQDKLIERMQSTLENKLDGLDEVVVELIQVKTENENLRIKLNQMTKENYELKNNLESFRPVGFGFYVK